MPPITRKRRKNPLIGKYFIYESGDSVYDLWTVTSAVSSSVVTCSQMIEGPIAGSIVTKPGMVLRKVSELMHHAFYDSAEEAFKSRREAKKESQVAIPEAPLAQIEF